MTTTLFTFPTSLADSQYDALIIGAVLAGLTAAALLARRGAHVLVCGLAGGVGITV